MSDGSGKECEKCGTQVSITAVLCKRCNEDELSECYCPSCSEVIDEDEPTCPYCGEDLS